MSTEKIKWKLMQQIVGSIQTTQGIIFGGYVRDRIIHDHYADLFYQNSENQNYRYGDPLFKPESLLRLLIPNDIDCFMHSSQIIVFKNILENNLLKIQEIHDAIPCSIYFPDVGPHILHTKWKITFATNPILKELLKFKQIEVAIDILHSDIPNLKPPFGTIDFECNGIILTSDNDYKLADNIGKNLSPKDKLNKINSIIEDIINLKAVVYYDNLPKYRIINMIKKNWTIKTRSFITEEKSDNDVCFICLDIVKNKHIKLNCCNGRMHISEECSQKMDI
jgi:hypothetical protein